ncbi:signal recognition particle [Myriangium duriaei CBS 260.36]|uniref:Signal recognition particle subunit SRP68 n=1 Tax=Myriangium duriaei CBS 260.36 TaxID=1168546 RepID=A0A9P4J868_9PEZI|nr:signal recognition particle [Myriangium duriaei CBS 260.36]
MTMDITEFAIGLRDSSLLLGDYRSYRKQLSQKLLAIRRRLGRANSKNQKFQKKEPVTAENVKSNKEYAHLLLLSAERAWAHAMQIKSTKSEETTGQAVTGNPRDHILTRLSKASKHARELYTLLQDRASSGSSETDILEARAYLGSMAGAWEFEKQSEGQKSRQEVARKERWHPCLKEYAVARVVYAALLTQTRKDIFKDFINNTIDPTIRYAAYQAKLPRTVAVSSAALKFFPSDEAEISDLVKRVDSEAFSEQKPVKDAQVAAASGEVPSSIEWRGRSAAIVDASIGQALAQASSAERTLEEFLKSNTGVPTRQRANAYDDILIAYQDAVDATRRATEELEKEGVDEGDSRMQDLRVSSLAINYDLVSWRVGRNRVLIGQDDGRSFPEQEARKPKRPRKDGKPHPEQFEPRSKKLGRLRERNVLYDSTIQSIDAVKSLRGAMRDAVFVAELEGRRAYFQALKCLNIAISHSMLSNQLNALALLSRASTLASQAASSVPKSDRASSSAPTLDIHPSQLESLQKQLRHQIQRHQAMAEMRRIEQDAASAAAKRTRTAPLVEHITSFPAPGVSVDLTNLVTYPPRIEPIPVKPLFFDVAFNYLEYPGQAKKAVEQKATSAVAVNGAPETASPKPDEKKRGWFGFGR